jgi:hypothetical protein
MTAHERSEGPEGMVLVWCPIHLGGHPLVREASRSCNEVPYNYCLTFLTNYLMSGNMQQFGRNMQHGRLKNTALAA